MQLTLYSDVHAFQNRVLPALMKHESENNLMIGILDKGARRGAGEDWLMGVVEAADGMRLVTLRTPPHNLLIASAHGHEVSEAALHTLAESVGDIPGVLAAKPLASAFARQYESLKGGAFEVAVEERIYELRQVEPVKHVGDLRLANERDMHFLPYWLKAFEDEALGGVNPLSPERIQALIADGDLYVLEAYGQPVCMAGAHRRTPHGRAIGPVYTPPFERGRGYATDCVAQLSQRLLDAGNDFCALFTDLSNPASNSAYIHAGYRAVCDFTQLTYKA